MENEFEKAKKFLKKIRWIDNEIDALIEDKKSYMDLATKRTRLTLGCAKILMLGVMISYLSG